MLFAFFKKPIAWAVSALLIVLALWFFYARITANPKAEARLGRNTTEAAQQSGQDASNTVADAGDRQAGSETLTRHNEKEIRNAEGALDPVNSAVRDAGLRSLCRRTTYRERPECVQHPDSK